MIRNINWHELLLSLAIQPSTWFIFASLILLTLLWRFLHKRSEVFELLNEETGTINVSKHALTKLIQKSIQAIQPQSTPRVSLHTSKGRLTISANIKLFTTQNIRELSHNLRETISNLLSQNLGLDKIANIHITVTEFSNNPSKHIEN